MKLEKEKSKKIPWMTNYMSVICVQKLTIISGTWRCPKKCRQGVNFLKIHEYSMPMVSIAAIRPGHCWSWSVTRWVLAKYRILKQVQWRGLGSQWALGTCLLNHAQKKEDPAQLGADYTAHIYLLTRCCLHPFYRPCQLFRPAHMLLQEAYSAFWIHTQHPYI